MGLVKIDAIEADTATTFNARAGLDPATRSRPSAMEGHRLRVAGVGFQDRRLLLGHKSGHVTTHYSAPEIGALIEASEKACALRSRGSHALTIVRARAGALSH